MNGYYAENWTASFCKIPIKWPILMLSLTGRDLKAEFSTSLHNFFIILNPLRCDWRRTRIFFFNYFAQDISTTFAVLPKFCMWWNPMSYQSKGLPWLYVARCWWIGLKMETSKIWLYGHGKPPGPLPACPKNFDLPKWPTLCIHTLLNVFHLENVFVFAFFPLVILPKYAFF